MKSYNGLLSGNRSYINLISADRAARERQMRRQVQKEQRKKIAFERLYSLINKR